MTFPAKKPNLSWKLLWLLIPILLFLTAVIVPSSYQEWTGFKKGAEKESLKVTEGFPTQKKTSDINVTKITEGFPTQKKTSDINVTKITTTSKIDPGKTLWDWMSLLLAPAALAGLAFVFQTSQEKSKNKSEEVDRDRVADQQREDRDRVADQQREAALQSYLDNLSNYLVDKGLGQLLESKVSTVNASLSVDKEAALNVIKAKTLSLLRLFKTDMPRKASVLSFLGDAKLLPVLKLDLSGSEWESAFFRKANLSRADLSGANLRRVNLSKANLSGTTLREADLSGAKLSGADLNGANLRRANLCGADLGGAELKNADLRGAKLSGADLSGAELSGANLKGAKLSKVNLNLQKIKLACNWEQAIYVEDNKLENDKKVEELKQNKLSDPKQLPDCSHWERLNPHSASSIA